jgi:DUF917 family protein
MSFLIGRHFNMPLNIGVDDLEDLARGAAFLGTGGGGDPYIGRLFAQESFARYGVPRIMDASDVPDNALVCSIAGFGAPTVQVEKLIRGDEVMAALKTLEAHLGRSIDALVPAEIGGGNSLLPLAIAAMRGLPVVDGDGMGRAFPELQMNSFSLEGIRSTPLVVIDEFHNSAIIDAVNDRVAEGMARALSIQMGLRVFVACFPMSGAQLKSAVVRGTLSAALRVGRAIRLGRSRGDAVAAVIECLASTQPYGMGYVVFDGKIADLQRNTADGFAFGTCRLASLDGSNHDAIVEFQNENLVVRRNEMVLAVVPDLICIVDRDTGEPIPTQSLRYGQRVKVIAVPAPACLRTPAALAVMGPSAFHLSVPFVPVEKLARSAEEAWGREEPSGPRPLP